MILKVNPNPSKTVVSAIGTYIGEVYEIEIDPSTWSVKSLNVKLSDKAIEALGLKKTLRRTSVRIPTTAVADVGIIIKLTQSLVDLKQCLCIVWE